MLEDNQKLIDELDHIEASFKEVFEKNLLIRKRVSKQKIIYGNNEFALVFSYDNQYIPMNFEGIIIILLNSPHTHPDYIMPGAQYEFMEIVSFMQHEWKEEESGKPVFFEDYAAFIQSHITPFLKMGVEGEEKLRSYIRKYLGAWRLPKD